MHLVWTIGFQVTNFLLLLFLLHRYLWKPVRATIERRKKEIDDADAGVKARAKAADESRAAYEAKAAAADHERARLLAGTALALAADRETVLANARAAADAEAVAAREELGEERRAAAGELTDTTLDLALSLARKLLDEVRGAAIAGAFLDRICEHLDGLPADELASLRSELEARSTIEVATAPALDDAARARLRARLAPYFGAAAKLDFVVDDALIAGAELRFPHARLGHSFQHSLAAARRELTAHGAGGAGHPALTTHEEIVDK
jgi:F-type H+-transporting ATPase subunit b